MRIVEIHDWPHTVKAATLRLTLGIDPSRDEELRLRLPVKSPVVTISRRRGKPSTITFASLSKAVLQVSGPRETIDAIYKETL